jgi:hypothetical protein
MRPVSGPQPGADSGSESGTQRLPGGAGGRTTPVPGPPTGSQPAAPPRSEPAHAAKEGLARSPWFQRTVPASVGGDGKGGDKGDGKGSGTAGSGAKGNGKGAKGKAGAKKGAGRSGGNGRMTDPKAVSASTLNWATAGEDGWSAVRRKLGETAQQAKVNDPLPRRTPGSRLVPGSAGERRLTSGDGAEPEPPSQHTADQLRSRLEGYQQGLARGRGEPGPAGQQPEEQ